MRIYIAAYALLFGFLTYLGLAVAGVVPQLAERDQSVPLEAVLVFITVFGVLQIAVITAAARWREAPRRRWFWIGGTLPAVMFFADDVPKIVALITQPSWAAAFGSAMLIALGTLVVAAGVSFRDARRAAAESGSID